MYINKPNFYKAIRVAKVPDYETIPNELYNDLYTAINENNDRGALIQVEAGYYEFGTQNISMTETSIIFDDGVVLEIREGVITLGKNTLLRGNAVIQASKLITVPYLLLIDPIDTVESYCEIDGLTLISVSGGGAIGGYIINTEVSTAGASLGYVVLKNCDLNHAVATGETFPAIRLGNGNHLSLINTTVKSTSDGIFILGYTPAVVGDVILNNVIMELGGSYYLDSETDVDVFAVNTYVTKPMGSTASITERITDGLTVEQYVKAY